MTPQELKNSILQLAIEGRLVEQREEEGTAEELYAQIQAEKAKLIAEGKLKKQKALPEIMEAEMPFEIPKSWKWVRLGEIVKAISAGGDKPKNFSKSITKSFSVPVIANGITNEGIFGYTDVATIKETSITVSGRGTIGYTVIRNYPYLPIVRVIVVLPMKLIDMKFLKYSLDALLEHGIGSAVKQLTVPMIIPKVLPLPPLAEQHRIVAKIEELLPHIERYEKAWSRLEDFNKRFPSDMQKSLLQYAIEGRLVEQRKEEGTAEELYAQIQAEKKKLIAEGKLKKQKALPEITEAEIPFEIPKSWKWVRLGEVCKSIADGDHQAPPQVSKGIPFLVISNISTGKLDFTNTRFVSEEYFSKLSFERIAEYGDILFSVTGSYGIPVKVEVKNKFCFQRHIALLKIFLDWDFTHIWLKTPLIKSQCDKTATGTAQKTVGLNTLKSLLLPLPPLAEQHRIVARLEELLPLCERLKNSC